jgi:hypothetical protein
MEYSLVQKCSFFKASTEILIRSWKIRMYRRPLNTAKVSKWNEKTFSINPMSF